MSRLVYLTQQKQQTHEPKLMTHEIDCYVTSRGNERTKRVDPIQLNIQYMNTFKPLNVIFKSNTRIPS